MRRWMLALVLGLPASLAVAADAPAPRGTAVLTLEVLDPSGAPVEDARFYVRGSGAPKLQESFGRPTDAKGHVSWDALVEGREYEFEVQPPMARDDLAPLHGRAAPGSKTIRMPAGFTVRGSVLGADAQPVRATVHYRGKLVGGSLHTEPDGTFIVRHLALAATGFAATPYVESEFPDRSELEGLRWTDVAAGETEVSLTVQELDPAAASKPIAIRVIGPDGRPSAEVTVSVTQATWGTTLTASAGTVTARLRPGPAEIRVFAARDAKGAALPWAFQKIRVEAGEKELAIRMTRASDLRGLVVGANGKPLAGIEVVATEPGAFGPIGADPVARATSAKDGTFRLVGLSDAEWAVATVETTTRPASATVRARPGLGTTRLVVTDAQPTILRVLDPDRRPLVGAKVEVVRWQHEDGRRSRGSGIVSTSTDARGTVTIPPQARDADLALEITPSDARKDDLAPYEVDEWKPTTADIILPAGFSATLRVLDSDGRPVAAEVQRLIPAGEELNSFGGWSRTDPPDAAGFVRVSSIPAAGGARFAAIPSVATNVFPGRTPWVHVTPERREVTLQIATRGAPLAITAAGATGATHVANVYADLGHREFPVVAVALDDEGAGRVPEAAPGRYIVTVMARGGAAESVGRADVDAFDGKPVVVELGPPQAVRVIPKLPEDAEPPQGAVMIGDKTIADLASDGAGGLQATGLPPGRYAVVLFSRIAELSLEGSAYVDTAGDAVTIELRPR